MVLLKQKDAADIIVTGGGIVPKDDIIKLKEAGITEVFGPGTPIDEIIEFHKKVTRK